MKLSIFTDGGSRGNPGAAAIGVVVKNGDTTVYEIGKTIGTASNNVAEYSAVIEAFSYLTSLSSQPSQVEFFLDSLLVVQQLNGNYKIKHPDMIMLFNKIASIRSTLPYPIHFSHVPRAQNARADQLVNQALDSSV